MDLTTYRLRIVKIISETSDTKTFVLQPLDDIPFAYQAGQFLTLLFEEHGQEVRRSFSFSTAPEADALPAITIDRIGWFCERHQSSEQHLDEAQRAFS